MSVLKTQEPSLKLTSTATLRTHHLMLQEFSSSTCLLLGPHSPSQRFLVQDREKGEGGHDCQGKNRLEGDVASGCRQFVEGGTGTDEEK